MSGKSQDSYPQSQGAPPAYQPYEDPPPSYTPTPNTQMYSSSTVVTGRGMFCREARFDGIAQPQIPPPPPGAYPNMYQQQIYNYPTSSYGYYPAQQHTTPIQTSGQQVVMVNGLMFDKHARFDGIAQPCIPPPPPGIPPNAFQIMAAQGQPINVAFPPSSRR